MIEREEQGSVYSDIRWLILYIKLLATLRYALGITF